MRSTNGEADVGSLDQSQTSYAGRGRDRRREHRIAGASFAQEPKTKIRLGIVPLISSGPIFVAAAKGYFDKVNLDVDIKYFADGALAIPALIAGEIDCTVSTLNAGLFNAVSQGRAV